jgi:hypothetical protein
MKKLNSKEIIYTVLIVYILVAYITSELSIFSWSLEIRLFHVIMTLAGLYFVFFGKNLDQL